MQSAPVPAAVSNACAAKAAAKSKEICASVSVIWQIIWWKPKRDAIVSQEEVLEILERAERNGFVHQITNIDGEDKIFAICNCAPGVCNALRTSQLFNTPNMSRSAYRAHVEAGKCVACGQCVEVCPVALPNLGRSCVQNKARFLSEIPASGYGKMGTGQMGSGLPGSCQNQLL